MSDPAPSAQSKHDETCLRRRQQPPLRFLCSCGISDEEFEAMTNPAREPIKGTYWRHPSQRDVWMIIEVGERWVRLQRTGEPSSEAWNVETMPRGLWPGAWEWEGYA